MTDEILDNDVISKKKNPAQLTFKNWISLLILWFGIFNCAFYHLIMDLQVLIAAILLLIATIISYLNFKLGVKLSMGLILIGALSLVQFFPHQFQIGFYILGIPIQFELLLFIIGIVHYRTNRPVLSEFLKSLFGNFKIKEDKNKIREAKILSFKSKFLNKEIRELESIINNENFVPEAIQAAKELIQEKNHLADSNRK